MPVKLVVFDLDGTLVDTIRDITDALNYALSPYASRPLAVEDTVSLVGEGISRLIEKVLPSERAGFAPEVQRRFLYHYSLHLTDQSRPYPEVVDTLAMLGGLKKAVVSNKREALSKRLLQELGLALHFDLVVGSDTTDAKKPSPVPVLHVLRKLGVGPEEAVMVGDSNLDIEAGRGAGLMTIAVSYGYRPMELLKDADRTIGRMSDLVPLLFGMGAIEEKRKEKRYSVPGIYKEHISVKVDFGGGPVPVALLDLSKGGLGFESSIPVVVGAEATCTVSVPKAMTKEVPLLIKARHVVRRDGLYRTGAEIVEVKDELWFRIFTKVLDQIATYPE